MSKTKAAPKAASKAVAAPATVRADKIRVCTYDGPGAEPVIREVPWPKVGRKARTAKWRFSTV